MVQQVHGDMQARVQNENGFFESSCGRLSLSDENGYCYFLNIDCSCVLLSSLMAD